MVSIGSVIRCYSSLGPRFYLELKTVGESAHLKSSCRQALALPSEMEIWYKGPQQEPQSCFHGKREGEHATWLIRVILIQICSGRRRSWLRASATRICVLLMCAQSTRWCRRAGFPERRILTCSASA